MAAPKPSTALSLQWTFGFSKELLSCVHNLTTPDRPALFYVAAHTGVIYDYAHRTQQLLQGHVNPISCTAVSADKRWIVTADAGADSLIVVWDALSGTPVKTLFSPHPHGVASVDISNDALFVVSLGAAPPAEELAPAVEFGEPPATEQQIALWEWTAERDDPLFLRAVPTSDTQHLVRFDPTNPREIVSNGNKKVLFWSWAEMELSVYSAVIAKRDFAQAVGRFTVSSFLPETSRAVTGTVDGDLVLWDPHHMSTVTAEEEVDPSLLRRNAAKIIRLNNGPIAHLSVMDEYLVVAGEDGAVRFYDFQFRLEAWFEDLAAGPVTSVSFSMAQTKPAGMNPGTFWVPDFVVGTREALIVGVEAHVFDEVNPENRRGTLLVQGLSDEVHCVAAHPSESKLAIACYNGTVQLWDYDVKLLLMVREFDPTTHRPQCLAFDPTGSHIVVGFTSAAVKVIDAESLEDLASFRISTHAITDLRFSASGRHLAAADAGNHVLLWRNEAIFTETVEEKLERMLETEITANEGGGNAKQPASARMGDSTAQPNGAALGHTYSYLGRYQSHSRAITGLEFGILENGQEVLVSVGEDRHLVEYNLEGCSQETGVILASAARKIELSAIPTTCAFHPLLDGDREDRVITASNEFKFKEWNASNKQCRRTKLGPTFGGPVNRLRPVPQRNAGGQAVPSQYMAYATHERVVGLAKLPFTGSGNKYMGLIAHPGPISSIDVSHDGSFLITTGSADLTVSMWAIDTSVLDRAEAEGGSGVAPFVDLLDGGRDGDLYNDIVDYFYYAQIRSQGEDTTEEREITGEIPLTEIPAMMRALGCYLSESEMEALVTEAKYSKFTATGEMVSTVNLEDFITLYVNHRPVVGVGKDELRVAFRALGAASDASKLDWNAIRGELMQHGEKMSEKELGECLELLMGADASLEARRKPGRAIGGLRSGSVGGGTALNYSEFADQVLGFEDYDPAQAQAAAAAAAAAADRAGEGPSSVIAAGIPDSTSA